MESGQGKAYGEGQDVLSELQLFQNPTALMHLHLTHFEEASEEFRTDFNEVTLETTPPPPIPTPHQLPLSHPPS